MVDIIKDDYLYKHKDGYIVACLSINDIPLYEEYYPNEDGTYSNRSALLFSRNDLNISNLTEMGKLDDLGYLQAPTELIINIFTV